MLPCSEAHYRCAEPFKFQNLLRAPSSRKPEQPHAVNQVSLPRIILHFAFNTCDDTNRPRSDRTATMQSLVQRAGMVRGLGRYCGLAASQQSRFIHLAPPRATADGEAKKAKVPVVGKAVLAKRLSETHKEISNKLALEIVDTLLDDIMLTVAEGEVVTIPGFGSFKKRHRPARKGRNPSTGEEMNIPEKDAPAFSAGTVFKGVVQTGSWEAYDELVAKQKAEKAAKGKK